MLSINNLYKYFICLKINCLIFIFAALLLSSCWNNSPYKGYSQTQSGLYYKLLIIGDGAIKPRPHDQLQLAITYRTMKDSVFMDTYSYNETGKVILPLNHSSFKGSFEEGLTSMNVGDVVSFIVSADSLFEKFFRSEQPLFLPKGSFVKMDVMLYGILNNTDCQLELKKYKELVEDQDINERCKLNIYLDTNQIQYSPISNGMYYVPIKQGVGDRARRGNQVTVNYKGYFLNGKQFESTYERGQPLEFTLGVEGQVINGFQTAICLMNEGAKTKFIIPSHLAFGEKGSSTHIVPSYTTVIYEIELINLKKK
jgi:FKBP-type peptidyl-prolyl cis-trans isomerase FkpA